MKLRGMALSCYYKLSTKRDIQRDESKYSSAHHIVQSLNEPLRSHKKRHAVTPDGNLHGEGSAKRPCAGPIRDDNVIVIEDSEPEEGGGSKVEPQQRHEGRQRTKVDKGNVKTGESEKILDSKKILKSFRVDEKKLAKRDKYQVLWFPMEDPLTESDKQARREVKSEHVC